MRLRCICKAVSAFGGSAKFEGSDHTPPPHPSHLGTNSDMSGGEVSRYIHISQNLKPRCYLSIKALSDWSKAVCVRQWNAWLTHGVTPSRTACVLHSKLVMRHEDLSVLFADWQLHNKPYISQYAYTSRMASDMAPNLRLGTTFGI